MGLIVMMSVLCTMTGALGIVGKPLRRTLAVRNVSNLGRVAFGVNFPALHTASGANGSEKAGLYKNMLEVVDALWTTKPKVPE